jgi:hypothetical protein
MIATSRKKSPKISVHIVDVDLIEDGSTVTRKGIRITGARKTDFELVPADVGALNWYEAVKVQDNPRVKVRYNGEDHTSDCTGLRLPTKEEMDLLILNEKQVSRRFQDIGWAPLTGFRTWTGTEIDSDYAWLLDGNRSSGVETVEMIEYPKGRWAPVIMVRDV